MSHIIFIIVLLFQFNTYAAEESIRDFAVDLEQLFGIASPRSRAVADLTHFMAQINPNRIAEASYNPVLNTIFLKKENLISTGWMSYNVKSISNLKAIEPLSYSVKVSTIFHEMGHAEMDHFILKGVYPEDKMLLALFQNEFTPWVKRNFPGTNPKTLFHEFYGYYRAELIDTFFQDKNSIESFNGYNIFQNKCFNSIYLKKVVETMSREEFGQFLYPELDARFEESYQTRVVPRYVFIQGKDIDLQKNLNDPFKDSWKKAFWFYFKLHYKVPENMRELTMFFRTHHTNRKFIQNCRNQLWDAFHAINP